MEVNSKFHILATLPAGKEPPVSILIGDWMDPRAGLTLWQREKTPVPAKIKPWSS